MPIADPPWRPYCGTGPAPDEIWSRWNFDPPLLLTLGLLAGLLLAANRDRREQVLLATAVLFVVFVSPLCALSSALFAARTVHHILLVAVAAPLIAWALPSPGRPPALTAATVSFIAVFSIWHLPPAYGWALSHDLGYGLMQASLLISATMAWRALRAAPAPAAVAALLATMVSMGLLGAVLTFVPKALYAPHALTTAAWSLTPLADQQIAGLIMWVPAAAIYLAFALSILARALRPQALARAA